MTTPVEPFHEVGDVSDHINVEISFHIIPEFVRSAERVEHLAAQLTVITAQASGPSMPEL
jgi:hypothetical protein